MYIFAKEGNYGRGITTMHKYPHHFIIAINRRNGSKSPAAGKYSQQQYANQPVHYSEQQLKSLEIPLDGDDHEGDNTVPDVNMHDLLLPSINTTNCVLHGRYVTYLQGPLEFCCIIECQQSKYTVVKCHAGFMTAYKPIQQK